MRILITYGRRPPYPPLGLHLEQAFREAGHEALLLCVRDRPWWATGTKRLPHPWKARWAWDVKRWAPGILWKALARHRPDVILEIDATGELFPPAFMQDARRRFGARWAIWLVEGPLPQTVPPALAAYDLLTSTSSVAVQQLRNAGFGHARYLPFATDPKWFCLPRLGSQPRRTRIGFIGAYSLRRAALLESVREFGLSLWGSDWKRSGAPPALRPAMRKTRGVFGRDLVRCYQRSEMFLSIQREHMMTAAPSGQRVGTGLSFRHFDVPACGGLLLSDWVIELPEAFTVGEEVEVFASAAELREKARFLLSHETRRRHMIQRARQRVLDAHTYRHRAQQWLTRLREVA